MLKVTHKSEATRCETCHQADCFDANNEVCNRCIGIDTTGISITSKAPKVIYKQRISADTIIPCIVEVTFCLIEIAGWIIEAIATH